MNNNMDICERTLCIKNNHLVVDEVIDKHSLSLRFINNINKKIGKINFISVVFLRYPQYPQCIRMKEVLLT